MLELLHTINLCLTNLEFYDRPAHRPHVPRNLPQRIV